eukprot:1226148-Pyramimonas_sp.AAC.1
METEIHHRTRAAWTSFTLRRQALTSARYPLAHRFQLCNGTLTQTALRGAETWAPAEPLRQRLRRTQRRVLRVVIFTTRRRITHRSIPRHSQSGMGDGATDEATTGDPDATDSTDDA